MKNKELTNEQLVEQTRVLQERLHGLEKTAAAQRETEEALKTSEKNLSAILEKNADGIVIVDTDGTVLYVNPAAESLFGRSKEDFLGYPFGFPVSADNAEDSLVIRKGDTLCEAELRVVQVHWQRRPAFQLSVRDITERKQAEEDLRNSREQLRSLVSRLESVREQEKTAIAREIHDELGQQLTAIKMHIVLLSQELESAQVLSPRYVLEEMESMIVLIDRTIKSVRNITTELRPWVLDNLDLRGAIEWLAQETQRHSGITCNLRATIDDIQMDSERSGSVFRILQEALTNVVRHAETKKVDIFAHERSGNLFLELRDYGRGISDEELSKQMTLGILGMKERALFLGGELKIRGIKGAGTTVTLSVPIEKSSQSKV